MRKPSSPSRFALMALSAALALVLLGGAGLQALAQDDPPTQTPYPTQTSYPTSTPYPTPDDSADSASDDAASAGDVEWTLADDTFTSLYPLGFRFSAQIESSAGDVARVRVVWTHTPGTQRSRPAEYDADADRWVATWNASGSDAVPPWVGVTYRWEATDTAGNSFESGPVEMEYADETREWIRAEGEDIIVFTQGLPDDVGEMVVDAMAEQRELYREAWGDVLPYKPRAILFGDREAWEEWQITYVDPRILGTTSSDWGATVQRVSGTDYRDLAYGTVPHEVAHIYQDEFVGFLPVSWFNEGNATFFEANQQYDYLARVRQIAASGNLPNLLEDTGPSIRGTNARDGYDIGYTFWRWLTETYGVEAHREVMQAIRGGTGRNAALEQVTGLTLREIESQWRVWLGASDTAPTLFPTPTMVTFPTVTPFGR